MSWLAMPSGRRLEPVARGFRGQVVEVRDVRADHEPPRGRAGSAARLTHTLWHLQRTLGGTRYRQRDVLAWARAWVDHGYRAAGDPLPAWRGYDALACAIALLRDAELGLEVVCTYCDEPATSVDHVLARSNGGTHAAANVMPACRSCNSSKRDRDVKTWLASKTGA